MYDRNQVIENVKLLTQEENAELIMLIVKKAEQIVLDYTKREEITEEMSDIVEDIACWRYNLVGREGVISESVGRNSLNLEQNLPKNIKDRLLKYTKNVRFY
ncbi:phage head-tail connector protein [Tepidimicrobium xylanilyticum]